MPQIIYANSSVQRSDENYCFNKFKKIFRQNNFDINTYDIDDNPDIEFAFQFNYKKLNKKKTLRYCIWPEAEEIDTRNSKKKLAQNFNKIFTTFDDHIDNKKFFKIKYPINFLENKFLSFDQKKNFSCMISSNKNLSKYSRNSGYSERVKLIEWVVDNNFESFFHLYGNGWEKINSSNYFFNRYFLKYFNLIMPKIKKNYYLGPANSKAIYSDYKFIFCYENVLNQNGYFCELIFDAFNYGSIPVYWGAKNVLKYIPEECFIDRRNFKTNFELFKFLKSIDSKKYLNYQKNILNFYKSSKKDIFSVEFLTNKIIKELKKDLTNENI